MSHISPNAIFSLEHLDLEGRTSNVLMLKVGGPSAVVNALAGLADAGHREVIYNPAGPDVARELKAFARIGR